ncbi:protein-lysine N-methyltransferase EEF2KMT [Neodiprion virginianus]|uniref:protein-lysine N-methyltransferase EEF2KMT n=1 Tax=Neodiprion virginianus TaxID=2961670 RepID=UPI001EE761CA|nr:protein-lysine N-methyltransferase EEF2KMT [Neodiprion virginianus]
MVERGNIDLNFVQRQFLACTPINKLRWNNFRNDTTAEIIEAMTPEMQRKILEKTVNTELVKKYPMKRSYQKSFLKRLINELENHCNEVHDEMYSTYCSLVSSDDGESSTQYRHFLYNENPTCTNAITLQESVSIVSLGTTGLCTWQAGLGLAEWCMENKELLRGRKILELGCGVGLTGLAIIRSCAPKEYIFSDFHPAVLTMLCKNIQINFSTDNDSLSNCYKDESNINLKMHHNGVNIDVRCLPWEKINDGSNKTACIPVDAEIILAADVLYDDSCFHSLASALNHLLGTNGTYAVVAATIRNTDTISKFTEILGAHDLVYHEMKLPKREHFIRTDDTPIRMMKIVNSSFTVNEDNVKL